MRNLVITSILFFSTSSLCFAAKVVQINANSVVISTDDLKNENAKAYIIDLGQGEQCSAKLVSKKQTNYLLDTRGCTNKEKIRAGQIVTEAIDFEEPGEPIATAPVDRKELSSDSRKFVFSLTPAFMVSGRAYFNNVYGHENGISGYGAVGYEMNSALSLKAEFGQNTPNSFNFSFGLGNEFERTVTKVEIDGVPFANSASGKVSSFFALGSVNYRWEIFYLGGGFMATSLGYSDMPPAWNGLKSSIGAEFNLGWFVNERVAIDIVSRAIALSAKRYSGSGGTVIDLGTGTLNSLNFGAKIFFP